MKIWVLSMKEKLSEQNCHTACFQNGDFSSLRYFMKYDFCESLLFLLFSTQCDFVSLLSFSTSLSLSLSLSLCVPSFLVGYHWTVNTSTETTRDAKTKRKSPTNSARKMKNATKMKRGRTVAAISVFSASLKLSTPMEA